MTATTTHTPQSGRAAYLLGYTSALAATPQHVRQDPYALQAWLIGWAEALACPACRAVRRTPTTTTNTTN